LEQCAETLKINRSGNVEEPLKRRLT
jgi:hypothetical protein